MKQFFRNLFLDLTALACSVADRSWWIIAYGSTLWARAGLALVSTLWAIGLWLPGDTMARPAFRFMVVIGQEYSEALWACLFSVHAAGMWWRTYADTTRPCWALAVNLLGVIIFCYAAFAILAGNTMPSWPAGVASDIGCAIASVLVAIRTHVNPDRGWRGD